MIMVSKIRHFQGFKRDNLIQVLTDFFTPNTANQSNPGNGGVVHSAPRSTNETDGPEDHAVAMDLQRVQPVSAKMPSTRLMCSTQ